MTVPVWRRPETPGDLSSVPAAQGSLNKTSYSPGTQRERALHARTDTAEPDTAAIGALKRFTLDHPRRAAPIGSLDSDGWDVMDNDYGSGQCLYQT